MCCCPFFSQKPSYASYPHIRHIRHTRQVDLHRPCSLIGTLPHLQGERTLVVFLESHALRLHIQSVLYQTSPHLFPNYPAQDRHIRQVDLHCPMWCSLIGTLPHPQGERTLAVSCTQTSHPISPQRTPPAAHGPLFNPSSGGPKHNGTYNSPQPHTGRPSSVDSFPGGYSPPPFHQCEITFPFYRVN